MISIITDKTLTRLDSEYINVTRRLVFIHELYTLSVILGFALCFFFTVVG